MQALRLVEAAGLGHAQIGTEAHGICGVGVGGQRDGDLPDVAVLFSILLLAVECLQVAALQLGDDSNLDFVMDFPLQSAIVKAFTTDEGWDSGMAALYESLSQDFAYPNPNNILIFMDNHDLSRIFSLINKDFDKWKMATAFLLTTRGIPQIWMGTELLNTGFEWNGHGKMRQDFNTITDDVDSVMAYEARNYMKTLLNYRKNSDVLQNGKQLLREQSRLPKRELKPHRQLLRRQSKQRKIS